VLEADGTTVRLESLALSTLEMLGPAPLSGAVGLTPGLIPLNNGDPSGSPYSSGMGFAGVCGYASLGCVVVGVRAMENLVDRAERKDPIPAPHPDSGFIGVTTSGPFGLVGEPDGRELLLVNENGRRPPEGFAVI